MENNLKSKLPLRLMAMGIVVSSVFWIMGSFEITPDNWNNPRNPANTPLSRCLSLFQVHEKPSFVTPNEIVSFLEQVAAKAYENRPFGEPDTRSLDLIRRSLPTIEMESTSPETLNPKWIIENAFGIQKETYTIQIPHTIPTSGSGVYRIVDAQTGENRAIMKTYPQSLNAFARELASSHFLERLPNIGFERPKILKAVRIIRENGDLYALLIEAGKGYDLEYLLRFLSKFPPQNVPSVNLITFQNWMRALGQHLAKFHEELPGESREHWKSKAYVEYEISAIEREFQEKGIIQKLLQQGMLTLSELQALENYSNRVLETYAAFERLVSGAHGDFHLGNVLVDPSNGTFSVIDTETMAHIFGSEGRFVSDPVNDLGRFTEALVFYGLSSGIEPRDIKILQEEFLNSYFETRGLSRKDYEPALQFYQLRLATVALKEKAKLDQKDMANGLDFFLKQIAIRSKTKD